MPPATSSRYAWWKAIPLVLFLLTIMALLVPQRAISTLRIYVLSAARPLVSFGHSPANDEEAEAAPEAVLARLRELEKENEALRDRLRRQQDRISSLTAALAQEEGFRKALADAARDPLIVRKSRSIPARIISRSTNWHSATLLINRGSEDGVREAGGIAVGGSVAGVVVEVGPRVSRMAYLTEPGVKIPVRILPARESPNEKTGGNKDEPGGADSESGADSEASADTESGDKSGAGKAKKERRRSGPALQGLLVGNGRSAILEHVPSQLGGPDGKQPVRKGDLVLTSGQARVFPRGLLLGTVESVEVEEDGPFLTIVINPAVSIAAMDTVRIFIGPDMTERELLRKQDKRGPSTGSGQAGGRGGKK